MDVDEAISVDENDALSHDARPGEGEGFDGDAESDQKRDIPRRAGPSRARGEGADLIDTLEMPVFKMPEEEEEEHRTAEPLRDAYPADEAEIEDGSNRALPLSGILRGRRGVRPARAAERTNAEPHLPAHRLLPDIVAARPLAMAMTWSNGTPPGSVPDVTPLDPESIDLEQVELEPDAPAPPTAPPPTAPPATPAAAAPRPAPVAAPRPPVVAAAVASPPPQPGTPVAPRTALASTPLDAPRPPVKPAAEPTRAPQPAPAGSEPLDLAMLFSTDVPGGEAAATVIKTPESRKKPAREDVSGLVAELLGDTGAPREEEAAPPPTPWWQLIFTEEYFRTIPMGFHRQTLRESKFIIDSLGVGGGATILDLCCGFGRHTMELAKRGYDMAGLDLSLPLLQKALKEAQRRNLSIKFIHGDVRELNFHEIFDAIFCYQTSFGYFDDRTHFNILRGVASALKPGGRFLLEVVNRDYVVQRLPTRVWWEGPECLFLEEVELDFLESVLHTKRSYIYDDGRPPWEQNIYVRLFAVQELSRMFELADLRVISVSGSIHTRGYFIGCDSPQIIMLVEKPA